MIYLFDSIRIGFRIKKNLYEIILFYINYLTHHQIKNYFVCLKLFKETTMRLAKMVTQIEGRKPLSLVQKSIICMFIVDAISFLDLRSIQ